MEGVAALKLSFELGLGGECFVGDRPVRAEGKAEACATSC